MLASHARPTYKLVVNGCTCQGICFAASHRAKLQGRGLLSPRSLSVNSSSSQQGSSLKCTQLSAHQEGRSARDHPQTAAQTPSSNSQHSRQQHTTQAGGVAAWSGTAAASVVTAERTTESRSTMDASDQTQRLSYPQGWQNVFHKGVAISVWQNSSDEASNWTAFMQKKNYFGQKDYVEAFHQSNDFWDKYEDDIKLVKALGCNSFRFSFEWSRIEPQLGHIDRSAIAQYHKILDSIQAAGLIPNATFHHFTHPQWFEARGAFTNPANIPLFTNYCSLIFTEFGSRVPFWATFNEPSCFCLCGYIMGLWSPGKRGRVGTAGMILGNMLKAHVAVYRRLKAMPFGDIAKIGIVHQHIRFVPKCNPIAGLIVRPVCHWMTYWFATQQMLDFFTTGRFEWVTPFGMKVVDFEMPEAVGALDWWGINYYSRPAINSWFQLVGQDASEPLTGMGMPLVPGDLHYHLMDAHKRLRVPIIVSETGVSDERHVLRAQCISTYYSEVLRAISDGADVRGIYYWTLMDNIEWHHGFNQHFGLYEWRPAGLNGNGGISRPTDGSQLKLRQGSKTLVNLHAAWPETWQEIRDFAKQRFQYSGAQVPTPSGADLRYAGKGVLEPAGQGGWLPGVAEEQQQRLREEVEQTDQQQQQKQEGSGVQEPLLGSKPGSITDAV